MSFNNINQTNFEHTFQAKVTFLSNTFFGSDVDISQKLDVRGASRFENISVFDIDIRGGALTVRNLDVSDDISVKNISVTEDISIGKQLKDGDDNFGSAGQVLSSDGTDLAWINTSDANVGSATNVGVNHNNTDADQWMTFVGANSGNQPIRVNNLLRINPSRSFVGIGTTDPNEQLHIHQIGTNAPILRVEATSTNPELDLKSASNGTAKIKFSDDDDAAGSIVYDHGHNKMKFMIGSTTSFWISPSSHFRLFEAFEDGSGSAGQAGQVLSSTGDKTEWINVGSVAAGSASTVAITQVSDNADHHIVFADTTSGIQALQASTGLKINPSNNQLTAGSFVKASNSGGFLKADGTEDNNTYLTSVGIPDKIVEATAQVECIGVGSSVITTTNGVERFVVTNDGHVYTPFDSTAKFGINMSPNSTTPTHNLQVKGDMEVREIDVLHKSFLRGSVYYQGSDDNQNTSLGGVRNLDLRSSGMFYRYEAQPFANWIPNFQHNQSTVNNETFEGSTFTVTVLVKQRSAGTPDGVTVTEARVDGTATGVDLVWEGGTAPPPSPGTGWDLWEFVVMKTSNTPTYQVFGRRSSTTAQPAGMTHSSKTSAYTLTANDDNRLITTTAGITVPANIFSAAEATTIYNNSSSSITITPAGGVTLRLSGSNITGLRTLAQRGVCTVMCVASNEFIITGSGLA